MRYACIGLMALVACSGTPDPIDQADAGFTQRDLDGDWRFAVVNAGPAVQDGGTAGWIRGTANIDAGTMTITSVADSNGSQALPGSSPSLQIDKDGFVSATSALYTNFGGRMTGGRDVIVATASQATAQGNVASLRLYAKTPAGATWDANALGGTTWRYHLLATGPNAGWEHGVASFNSTGQMTLTQRISPQGSEPDVTVGPVALSSSGIATRSDDPSWGAIVSADKNLMIATKTVSAPLHAYMVNVFTRTGGTFAQKDFEGRWGFYRLLQSPGHAGWIRGEFVVDAAGVATNTASLTDTGSTTTGPASTLVVNSDGTLTRTSPAQGTYDAVIAPDKDLCVRTESPDGTPVTFLQVSIK